MSSDADPYDMRVGRNLQRLRQAAGLSQDALARAATTAGMSMRQTTIVRIEGGQRALRLQEAEVFAILLQVPLESLTSAPGAQFDFVASARALLRERQDLEAQVVEAAHRYNRVRRRLVVFRDMLDGSGSSSPDGDRTQLVDKDLRDAIETAARVDPLEVARASLAVTEAMHGGPGIELEVLGSGDSGEAPF